jgi:hypothetical protein
MLWALTGKFFTVKQLSYIADTADLAGHVAKYFYSFLGYPRYISQVDVGYDFHRLFGFAKLCFANP